MSKDFVFFRFHDSEWLNDGISFESYAVKGVFIEVCAFYWFKECDLDVDTLLRRFKDAKRHIEHLMDVDLIKRGDDDKVHIKFLDKQLALVKDEKRKKVEAGREGGKASAEARKKGLFSND